MEQEEKTMPPFLSSLLFLALHVLLVLPALFVLLTLNEKRKREKKALREDRTPDLSLTKRVLYRLSY